MNNRWKLFVVVPCLWVALSAAQAETVVSLPAGPGEHFTVQSDADAPLLRVDEVALVSGTNIAIGTMGDTLSFTITNRTVMSFPPNDTQETLVLGSSNVADRATAGLLAGFDNTLSDAPYCSILGGRANIITNNAAVLPYYSVIAGGYGNVITAGQNTVISGGSGNRASGNGAAVAGGLYNRASGKNSFAAGGSYNYAIGSNSFAGGFHAYAEDPGAFVWADHSSSTLFSSSNDNEFAVRATGGVRFESELGTNVLPSKKSRYADNNIVAWGRIASDGALASYHFGIRSCSNTAPGIYQLGLDAQMQTAFHLIPVATIEADSPPVSAATARFIYVNQTVGTTNLWVYITDGDYTSVNNDFTIIVTGR
jgi:hypothetical protein